MIKKILFVLFFAGGISVLSAQPVTLSVGGSIGLGQIKGNTPSLTAFEGSIFIDAAPSFFDDFSLRLGYMYEQKVEYFLPENRTGKYYPSLRAFSLKAVLSQSISYNVYLEEGLGAIMLNDRTLIEDSKWNAGAGFHALIGLDLRDGESKGFRLGVGTDYGIAFTDANASYSNIYIQVQYYFL